MFQCSVPKTVTDYVSVVSWTIRRKSTSNEIIISTGESNDRFHVLPKFGNLVIENVEKYDGNITVRCTTKDSFNGLLLTSTFAYLFIDGMYLLLFVYTK